MKSLLVDLERLKYPHCGLGRFCYHLGKNLGRSLENDDEWHLHCLLPSKMGRIFDGRWESLKISPFHRFFPRLFPAFDLWHMTHQDSSYWPSSSRTPMILTIHDLNFLQEKKSFYKQKRRLQGVQARVKRSDMVIVISRYTEKCVRESLDLGGKEVRVIYNGVAPIPEGPSSPKLFPFLREKPYLLSVGVVRPKKNLHVLLDTIKELPEHHLVIVGDNRHPYGELLKKRVVQEGLERRVHLLGTVTDGERNELYRGCQGLLFPSLAEGFGFPVLEAMGCGRPVFLSREASLPEVAGDLGYFFDDFSPHSMAKTIGQGLEDFHRYPQLAQKSKVWASRFSWEKAALQYREAYLSLF